MAREWTGDQLKAIEARGSDILVSAAAGSGKTATLTERITRRVASGELDIGRTLIVTFTRAAANELRERIAASLADAIEKNPDDERLRSQLLALPSASIGTIHSFCLRVLRPNYTRFGLPPRFRVADGPELTMMRRAAVDETLDALYDAPADTPVSGEADFLTVADTLTPARNESGLADTLLSLWDRLSSYPRGVFALADRADELKRDAGRPFLETAYGSVFVRYYRARLASIRADFALCADDLAHDGEPVTKYLSTLAEDDGFAERLSDALAAGDFDACRNICTVFSFSRLPSVKKEAQTDAAILYKLRRDDLKELYKSAAAIFTVPETDTADAFAETATLLRGLYRVLRAFGENFSARKKKAGAADFSDLERSALELLTEDGDPSRPSAAARALAEQYDEVAVDEYQDTNRIQDAVFAAIGSGRRFLVGDVKQSIYGFRGAEPSIFAAYRDAFGRGDGGELIPLSANFRSGDSVISFVNAVSEVMFGGAESGIVAFGESDRLMPGLHKKTPPAEVILVAKARRSAADVDAEGDDDDDAADAASECDVVAGRVADLIATGRLADGSPIKPDDIAVILRGANVRASLYAEALEKRGVSCGIAAEREFFEYPEILLSLCVLNAADNPSRDVYLAGLARSPLFGFTLDDLVRVRRTKDGDPLWYRVRDIALDGTDDSNADESCDHVGISAIDEDVSFSSDADIGAEHSSVCSAADENSPSCSASVKYCYPEIDDTLREKCRTLYEGVRSLRQHARTEPTDRFFERVRRELGLYDLAQDELARARLDRLADYARRYEHGSFKGISGFIDYLGALAADGDSDASGAPKAETAGAVKIMSVHASKGLEYPVVIVADCGKPFNTSDSRDDMLLCADRGSDTPLAALKLRRSGELAKRDTLLRVAVAAREKELLVEEEMRILYVAMTRARERLIMTGTISDPEGEIEAVRIKTRLGAKIDSGGARCFFDWVIPAAVRSSDVALSCVLSDAGVSTTVGKADSADENDGGDAAADSGSVVDFSARFAFKYPYSHLARVPAKLTVSKLYPAVLDEGEEADENIVDFDRRPSFMADAETTSAENSRLRGTATHIFLQFADFNRLTLETVEDELDYLVKNAFMTSETAALVRVGELRAFAASELFSRIKNARSLWREFRFNVTLPADRFTLEPELREALAGEEMLVQGVVDALFVDADGKLVLADYKTDRLTARQLADYDAAHKLLIERHAGQLSYYREACAKMFGRSPDEVLIYSTASAKTYPV